MNYLEMADTWVNTAGYEVANVTKYMDQYRIRTTTKEFFDNFTGEFYVFNSDDVETETDCFLSHDIEYKLTEVPNISDTPYSKAVLVVVNFKDGNPPILYGFDYLEDFHNCLARPKQISFT